MPTNVEDVIIHEKEIVFKVKTRSGITDISQLSPVNISGSISATKGIQYISIESKGDYVWVST